MSQSIVRLRETRRRTSGLPVSSWRRADHPRVDPLELVGEVAVGTRRPAAGRGHPLAQAVVADQPLDLPGQRDRVTGREAEAHLRPVVEQLLVGVDLGDDRDRAGGEGPEDQARRRARASGGRADDVGGADQLGDPRLAGAMHADPLAQRLVEPRRRNRGVLDQDVRLPVELEREAAQGAQEHPQRAALLASAVDDPRRAIAGLAGRDLGRRAKHVVAAGEEPAEQIGRRPAGDRAGVEAAEEDLDDRPRDLRREHPLGRQVERRRVQGARVPQRRRGDARGERVVDVDDVEVDGGQQPLERAADVDRDRSRARARATGKGDGGADREHGRSTLGRAQAVPSAPEDRSRMRARIVDCRLGPAQLRPGPAGRRDDDAMAASGELRGRSGGECVHLMVLAPRIRRNVGDRQAVASGHRLRIDANRSGATIALR